MNTVRPGVESVAHGNATAFQIDEYQFAMTLCALIQQFQKNFPVNDDWLVTRNR